MYEKKNFFSGKDPCSSSGETTEQVPRTDSGTQVQFFNESDVSWVYPLTMIRSPMHGRTTHIFILAYCFFFQHCIYIQVILDTICSLYNTTKVSAKDVYYLDPGDIVKIVWADFCLNLLRSASLHRSTPLLTDPSGGILDGRCLLLSLQGWDLSILILYANSSSARHCQSRDVGGK